MKKRRIILFTSLAILIIGYLIPEKVVMPVVGATSKDYHPDSFWYYPWGRSVTHKGVDVFADKGTLIQTPCNGLVLYKGNLSMGGNVVMILGPKWRFHYLAHLDEIESSFLDFVSDGEIVGTVGDSGNAKGKPPHLHYSIITPIPYIWRVDSSKQGWKKMFYLNPIDKIR